ncbi:hypothetical protein ACKWTF_016799 [Chironomus riparius]
MISAEAGTGKSVTLKHLKIEIKKKYPFRWISYIDLRKCTKFFPEVSKNLNLIAKSSIKQTEINPFFNLLYDILNLTTKSKFEQELFFELFSSGNVTFLWDNIDKVDPLYNLTTLNLMTFIQNNSKISQIICTRPFYAETLENKFSIQSYRLAFLDNNLKMFLTQILRESFGNLEELNQTVFKIENLIKNLETRAKFEKNDRKLNVPSMINFIAETFIQKNHFNSSNIFEIYQLIFERKIKVFDQNSEFIKNYFKYNQQLGIKYSLREIYQRYALMYFLNEFLSYTTNTNESLIAQNLTMSNLKNLQILQMKFPRDTLLAEIPHMEILYVTSESHFRFLHKTFAEFFLLNI